MIKSYLRLVNASCATRVNRMVGNYIRLVLVFCIFEGLLAIPPPAPGKAVVVIEDRSVLHILLRRISLKSRYVDHLGLIHHSNPGGCTVRVDATYSVSDHALQLAATTISRMVRHMTNAMFYRVCSHTLVGVFTKAETLTVYPEYAGLRNPAGCGSGCEGHCATSCTFDHRKYSTLAGTGGHRAVVVDNNVLCDRNDPYFSQSNILLHEYAHTIMGWALTSDVKARIDAAYNAARSRGTWGSGYQMANSEEYWAVASSSFFNSEHNGNQGMNFCGSTYCTSEAAARYHIYQKDPNLYNLLAEVYGTQPGGLGTCTR